jgi:hypothetical protein
VGFLVARTSRRRNDGMTDDISLLKQRQLPRPKLFKKITI